MYIPLPLTRLELLHILLGLDLEAALLLRSGHPAGCLLQRAQRLLQRLGQLGVLAALLLEDKAREHTHHLGRVHLGEHLQQTKGELVGNEMVRDDDQVRE